MSGVYNNWLKVNNPDFTNNNIQMMSGGFQKPFYFGGSNVPNTLMTEHHDIHNSYRKKEIMSGQSVINNKTNKKVNRKIVIPNKLFKKDF